MSVQRKFCKANYNTHNEIVSYLCEDCKSSVNPRDLILHECHKRGSVWFSTHPATKNYSCSLCGDRFEFQDIDKHSKTHAQQQASKRHEPKENPLASTFKTAQRWSPPKQTTKRTVIDLTSDNECQVTVPAKRSHSYTSELKTLKRLRNTLAKLNKHSQRGSHISKLAAFRAWKVPN